MYIPCILYYIYIGQRGQCYGRRGQSVMQMCPPLCRCALRYADVPSVMQMPSLNRVRVSDFLKFPTKSLIFLRELNIFTPRDPRPGVAARGGAARRAAVALPFPATQCVVPGSTPMGSGGGVRCAGRGFEGGPGTPGKCQFWVRFGRNMSLLLSCPPASRHQNGW